MGYQKCILSQKCIQVLTSQDSDHTEIWFVRSSDQGVYVQSFSLKAPGVTKRAVLTDDEDGQRVIVKAPPGEIKIKHGKSDIEPSR
jgi:hypothetical protein